jgi:hypothetical protein
LIEFGAGDGSENNTRNLLLQGWHGVWIEVDSNATQRAYASCGNLPVTIINRLITVENILEIFEEAQVPQEPDLLSIDLDGNDYWIWQKIATKYKPRVVIIEYNGSLYPI